MVYSAESGSEGSSDASDENTNHQVCNITTSTLYILLNAQGSWLEDFWYTTANTVALVKSFNYWTSQSCYFNPCKSLFHDVLFCFWAELDVLICSLVKNVPNFFVGFIRYQEGKLRSDARRRYITYPQTTYSCMCNSNK